MTVTVQPVLLEHADPLDESGPVTICTVALGSAAGEFVVSNICDSHARSGAGALAILVLSYVLAIVAKLAVLAWTMPQKELLQGAN